MKENENNLPVASGFRLIVGYLGIFMIIIGVIILLPLFSFLFFKDEAADNWLAFFIPGISCIALGFLLSLLIYRRQKGRLENHEDIILVLLTWLLTIFLASIPYVFLDQFDYSFTKALFESTSGFTTTGYSMIPNDAYADLGNTIPNVYYFYRTITLFFGGTGLILILNSAISDKYNMRLYTADGHNDKLLPNIVKSARMIFSIYITYALIGTFVMWGVGQTGEIKMSLFEAFNYAISCLSPGGFGMHSTNVGYYNNFAIECVCMILMLLASTNFLIHMFLIKGKIKNIYNHCETRIVIFYLVLLIPLSCLLACYCNTDALTASITAGNIPDTFRISYFSLVSAFTTTGVSNKSILNGISTFNSLGMPFVTVMVALMVVGGQAGSVSGGIKLSRIAYIGKGLFFSYADSLSNKHKIKTHFIYLYGKKNVFDYKKFITNTVFAITYLTIMVVSIFIFVCYGDPIGDAIFDVSACIGTVGLTNGFISSTSPSGILWLCMILMFLGRIEILPLISCFAIIYNKARRKVE